MPSRHTVISWRCPVWQGLRKGLGAAGRVFRLGDGVEPWSTAGQQRRRFARLALWAYRRLLPMCLARVALAERRLGTPVDKLLLTIAKSRGLNRTAFALIERVRVRSLHYHSVPGIRVWTPPPAKVYWTAIRLLCGGMISFPCTSERTKECAGSVGRAVALFCVALSVSEPDTARDLWVEVSQILHEIESEEPEKHYEKKRKNPPGGTEAVRPRAASKRPRARRQAH